MARIIEFLPALGCVGGMGLCMWLMSRGHRSGKDNQAIPGLGNPEVAELRAEVERLRAEAQVRHEHSV